MDAGSDLIRLYDPSLIREVVNSKEAIRVHVPFSCTDLAQCKDWADSLRTLVSLLKGFRL